MKNLHIIKNSQSKLVIMVMLVLLPLFSTAQDGPGFPEGGDPGDEPQAPISYYWWVLVLVAVLYVWKSYYKNHPLAASKE